LNNYEKAFKDPFKHSWQADARFPSENALPRRQIGFKTQAAKGQTPPDGIDLPSDLMMTQIVCGLIRTYQKTLRRLLPKSCRFYPSCSDYAQEAIKRFGVYKGIIMASKRILHCHPLSEGGYDPVK